LWENAAVRHPVRLIPLLLLAAAGCADRKPARIDFAPPPQPVVDRRFSTLRATAVNKDGKPLDKVALAWSGAPAEVVEVSPGGTYQCLKTGDATITVSGGGVSAAIPLRCRIPTEIAMPAALRLVIGAPPVPLQPRALGEGGTPLPDVPVPLTSSDESIARIENGRAAGVAVGRASLRASLGTVVSVTPVTVVEAIFSGPLALEDGGARSFTLEAGHYEVEIDVKPAVRSPQGVTVSWEGVSCPAQLEAQSHRQACVVPDRAVVTVKNPATMGLGARVSGTLHLYRVPPS
jgi:hypothetical protein